MMIKIGPFKYINIDDVSMIMDIELVSEKYIISARNKGKVIVEDNSNAKSIIVLKNGTILFSDRRAETLYEKIK